MFTGKLMQLSDVKALQDGGCPSRNGVSLLVPC